jgi:4-amino-4-deoxy-L-arabinose transferase-like glycosyltransferase
MRVSFWAILAATAGLLMALVAMRPLLPIDETRYLSVAWEMWQSHDPLHLTKNGELYTHKTPLLFAMINLVWFVTGVSEFTARLVGPACAVAMVAGTGMLARRLWPQDTALPSRAMLALISFPVFLTYGSSTMFDALLGLCVLAGAAAIWRIGQGDHTARAWGGLGLALAFGIYAKGPVILVHLMPLLLGMRLWAEHPPQLRAAAKGFGLALLVTLALVALWLMPTLATAPPAFVKELLWTQSAARVAGGMAHDRPLWFLIALLPLILFPWGWSWALWREIGQAWRAEPALRFCALWAVSALLLFSMISGKQVHYLIPAFPAVALMVGFASAKALRGWGGVGLAIAAVLAIGLGQGLIAMPAHMDPIAPLWPLTGFGVVLLALALLARLLPQNLGRVAIGAGFALGLHAVIVLTSLYPSYDGQALANRLAQLAPNGLAVSNVEYHAEVNFLGRLTNPVALTPDLDSLRLWALAHPQGTVFGRLNENPLTAAPQEVFHFMGQDWGLWPAAAISRE